MTRLKSLSLVAYVVLAPFIYLLIRHGLWNAPGVIRPVCTVAEIVVLGVLLGIGAFQPIIAYVIFLAASFEMMTVEMFNTPRGEISGDQGWYTMPIAIAIYGSLFAIESLLPFTIAFFLSARVAKTRKI